MDFRNYFLNKKKLLSYTIENRRTCNELFLLAVANKYSISFKELERGVFDKFLHEDPDPKGDYLHSTDHFDRYVKEHEIKEVNIGAVVLYLKGVRLAVDHQENLNQVDELKDEIERLTSIIISLVDIYHTNVRR